jgi:hypothetical protein
MDEIKKLKSKKETTNVTKMRDPVSVVSTEFS